MRVYHTDEKDEYLSDEGCHIIEVLNNELHPEISIAQARVDPLKETVLHSLSGTREIYYVLEGKGLAFIGNEKQTLSKGDCIVIEPECPQAIKNSGNGELKFLCICQPRFQFTNYKELA